MLPLFKDNPQPLLGRLLSRSLEPAGQKECTGNPEKQTNEKKTLPHYTCGIQEVWAGGKHFQIVYVKNTMILL